MLSLDLMGNYVGNIVGEETISSFSLAFNFYWIEGAEAAVVVVALCASFE
jgi:hypothetical protein